MVATFLSLVNKIREEAFTEKDKGYRFEKLIKNYFLTSKKYISLLSDVWLWSEFPFKKDFGGKDTGIDLVAKTIGGEYWAIQCKCYAEKTVIDKPAVDSFLATSSRLFIDETGKTKSFSNRLWVTTTEKWGPNAKEAMENQQPPATVLNAFDIDADTTVDWEKLDAGLHGQSASEKVIYAPRPHQKTALMKAHEYYKTHDRGKLIMACGTGKTFTALRLVEQETDKKGLILALVPSIALINQMLNEWNTQTETEIYPICVCSDRTASRKKADNFDEIEETAVDLAVPACTNVKSVAKQLIDAKAKAKGMIVVYSTYQSIDVISKAQKYLHGEIEDEAQDLFDTAVEKNQNYTFDYIVCDEAHRTTGIILQGKEESAFVKVHNNEFIRAKKRLYMTATPRLYAPEAKKKAEENSVMICSMDDIEKYGEEIYRIGFGEAVEKGLLSDYKVLILTVRNDIQLPADMVADIHAKDKEINTDDAVKLVGCINALSKRVVPDPDIVKTVDPALMHRAVAFCSKISDSKAISYAFNEYGKKVYDSLDEEVQAETVLPNTKHIDGSMSARERNELIHWLKSAPQNGNECRILTNVRCLSEGVDVPSLDAVIFLSARNSQVDVVQSVGRVMRTAPGKKYGYIIIPVVIPADGDANTILDNNENYKVIWTVLNALRAHDDRFNAYVNKLELNEKRPTGGGTVVIGSGDNYGGGKGSGDNPPITPEQLLLFNENIQNALYAKMVLKVGTKRYWEQWAQDIADIAQRHIQRINNLINTNADYQTAFSMYIEGLHKNINPNINKDEAIEMLAQHMITKPVFDALFENYSFAQNNPISKSMKDLLDLVGEDAYEKDQKTLERFYKSVQERCEGIDNASGKQKVIIELYDKFFKKALPLTVEKLGIVYTPVEVVDFINKSVADVLKKEFKRDLSDENVHIIDPFTGTGTFIVRMIQNGLIKKEALERKYKKELHANEIVLLAYYIASINIENAFHDAIGEESGKYTPFDGICLTDTFQLYEDKDLDVERLKFAEVFEENSERVIAQSKTPVQVIVGNPPYSVGQTSANDNAQNEEYPKLEKRIANTYGLLSKSKLQKGLHDSYVKAFRWASDRIDKTNGGIIGFVSNAGWLDGNAMDGLRKCFEDEFSSIYVYNLRGDQRTIGEKSRKEGGKIFGSGSRTPISITILIKNPKATNNKAIIYYREIKDYMNREEKLAEISKIKSVISKDFVQKVLKPNEYGDWLNKRNESFNNFYKIDPEKKFNLSEKSIFNTYAIGIATNRDSWVSGFSKEKVSKNMQSMINFYNQQIGKTDLSTDKTKISWTRGLKKDLNKNVIHTFDPSTFSIIEYRPFNKINLYYHKPFIECPGIFNKIKPSGCDNKIICIRGVGSNKDFSAVITECIPDLQLLFNDQCFPLYWYEEKAETKKMQNLFDDTEDIKEPEYIRHDGITDFILQKAFEQYNTTSITKEDIFYYVYGLLHSEDYRTQFAADLKKMLPRIPLVEKTADFKAFSEAGRKLADLHLNYEKRQPPMEVVVEGDLSNCLVTKMRFKSKADKSEIIYNSNITIKNIPLEAYDYVVNGRSAIEWIMERYQVKTDKNSLITNDPNDWSKENNDPTYILDLLLSIITVSVETVNIVKSLPKVKFE